MYLSKDQTTSLFFPLEFVVWRQTAAAAAGD
jgi:hypothetical protein